MKLELARRLRDAPTEAEEALWNALRGRKLGGFKFRRQHVVAGYIADFYCAAVHLVVEVDGDSHAGRADADAERSSLLVRLGVRVLRFTNAQVASDMQRVLEIIVTVCRQRTRAGLPSPRIRGEGWGMGGGWGAPTKGAPTKGSSNEGSSDEADSD